MNTFDSLTNDILQFKNKPTEEVYSYVKNVYSNKFDTFSKNELRCLELFLIGANIKHRYEDFTKEQHLQWIRYVNDLIKINSGWKTLYTNFLNAGLKSV